MHGEKMALVVLPQCQANLTRPIRHKEEHIFAIFISEPRSMSVLDLKMLELLSTLSYKLLLLGHRSLIKKITQTAVINIVFQRIFKELDVSYASLHTFSKVTVTSFEN